MPLLTDYEIIYLAAGLPIVEILDIELEVTTYVPIESVTSADNGMRYPVGGNNVTSISNLDN